MESVAWLAEKKIRKIAKAIDYGDITKGRKRYRHKEVKAADLLRGISAEK